MPTLTSVQDIPPDPGVTVTVTPAQLRVFYEAGRADERAAQSAARP
jgi:hypothetical protein